MYYPVDSAPELTQVGFDVYEQKQPRYRYFALTIAILLFVFSTTTAVSKTLASVKNTKIELPKAALTLPPLNLQNESLPAVAASVDRSPELAAELEAWTNAQKDSDWAFYVHSLDNNEIRVEQSANEQFDMASIYKLFLLRPLAQKIPAEAWGSSNITDKTYLTCVDAMLAVSDNPCAEAIAGRLGWSTMQRQIEAAGYKQTVINRSDAFVSSAADTGLLLDRLYHGDSYDAKTKQIALDSLGKKKGTEAIRRACADCRVYNKTGDYGLAKHDAAIIEKNGKAYVVVIFSSNAGWQQLVEAASVISKHL